MEGNRQRIQKALESLLYLPHLKEQQDDASSPAAAASGRGPAGKGRVWDRGDRFRRRQTFKSGTWFAKPEPISPVECARRGWLNTAPDMLTCEVRGGSGGGGAGRGTWR